MVSVDFSKLKKHLKSLDAAGKQAFVLQCGTTLGYLRKRMYCRKPLGFDISCRIAATGVMTPEELRPHDFHKYVWGPRV